MPDVFGLSERAADRLAALLNEKPGGSGPSGRGSSGARIRFVKCLSATAVGGAGVLSECYPAQIIEPAGDKKLPAETGGLVLLTLIGSTGGPAVPVANASYLCVITGDAAGDESGSGSAVVAGRPRAFGIASAAGGSVAGYQYQYRSTFDIPTDNTWYDGPVSSSANIPSAGTYLLFATVCGAGTVSTLGTGVWAYGRIEARLFDVTGNNQISPGPMVVVNPQRAGIAVVGSATIMCVYTTTTGVTINLQARRVTGDGTVWSSASLLDTLNCFNAIGSLKLG